MRVRNLYNPADLKDRDPVVPWVPDGMTVSAKTTDKGCEITVTGDGFGWRYPPDPKPDGMTKTVWQIADGSYSIGIDNDTIAILPGTTILTRLAGYGAEAIPTMLQSAGLPLVFAAEDHPY